MNLWRARAPFPACLRWVFAPAAANRLLGCGFGTAGRHGASAFECRNSKLAAGDSGRDPGPGTRCARLRGIHGGACPGSGIPCLDAARRTPVPRRTSREMCVPPISNKGVLMMTRRRIFAWTVMLATLGAGLFVTSEEAQARCCRQRCCNRGCGMRSCGGGFRMCGRSRCGRCGGGCGYSNCGGGYAGGGCYGGCATTGGCAVAPTTTNPDGTIAPVPQSGTTAPATPPAPAPAPTT